jgi:cytochrome bd-type quinol oxidase subunit 2
MGLAWFLVYWKWRALRFCVLILTAHGATYLTMKTEGAVHERSVRIARRMWLAVIPAFLLITLLTWAVRPKLLQGIVFRPLAMLFSTTEPARRLTAADCAAPDASLIIGTAWWFPALILACGYLYIIQRHYSGKVNVSKDNQGLY